MALKIYAPIEVQGEFPAVKAKDVQMPDGSRLSDFNPAFPVVEAVSGTYMEPERFYQFGPVTELHIIPAVKDDGLAHEYWLEFQPQEGFTELNISIMGGVKWVSEPQYPVGKTIRVGICMGMAVMGIV